jgi:hypothetical protein
MRPPADSGSRSGCQQHGDFLQTRTSSQKHSGDFRLVCIREIIRSFFPRRRKRAKVVDGLCETHERDTRNVLRDRDVLRSGDLISDFMKRIGIADYVIGFWATNICTASCTIELYSIYHRWSAKKTTSCPDHSQRQNGKNERTRGKAER